MQLTKPFCDGVKNVSSQFLIAMHFLQIPIEIARSKICLFCFVFFFGNSFFVLKRRITNNAKIIYLKKKEEYVSTIKINVKHRTIFMMSAVDIVRE